jgi:CubicO group peptidase (beta-lactamase class C family)
MNQFLPVFSFSCLAISLTFAQQPATPHPSLLAEIPAAMETEIAAHHTAGAVTLVVEDGKVIHQSATGMADREKSIEMNENHLFWIASMTKSISVTAIMTLVDEGKLSLDEPASKWLPALGGVKTRDGSPPSRPITLRDLMSHTSGLAFPPRKADDGAQSLEGYTLALIKAPLAFEPGTDYEYGFGITVAGRIAEIVSGRPFDEFLQERLLDPLGMGDTTFHPDDRLRARIAKSYKTAEDGSGLIAAYNPFVTSDATVRRMTEPSGGLFSTAADLATFYEMVRNRGLHQGKRLVSEASIAEMTKPHTAGGSLQSYGLGWQCQVAGKAIAPGFSERSFGHGGAYGTHGWIDPERRLVAIFLVQNVLVKDGGKARQAFHGKIVPPPGR